MNHQHMGIIADLLSLVSSKSGLIFHAVSTNTWAESVALLKAKKVDMVSAVPITPKRKKYLNFSKKSIYSYPAVLVCNKNRDFTLNTTMNNKRIGIIKGNSLGEWIKKRYPLAHFIYFSKLKNAFNALQNNTIDFFGINGVTATYYINVVGYHESKIYTILPYMFHLKIALLKNVDPVVLTLIDEALSQITQKEFSDIYHKWTSVEIKKETNWKIVLSIIAIAMLIVLIFLFINKKLNRLVQKRTAELKELNENLEKKVEIRTEELALINQKMQENIRYASLIQNSILPQEKELKSFFQDSFILWEPKDIVGGDIYFFQQLNEDEALLFIVDCTGHGVSGAFVTMLVKAMQEQLLLVFENKDLKPNTILEYFEKTFQKLLRQKNTNTNVGFDAAVLYCNKATKKILFSGANIALYYTLHNQIFTKKPSRHTIGYNTSQETYSYKKMEIQFEDNMTFYLTTDGYIDQNGGNKGFPFGKQRFFSLLEQSSHTPLNKQKQLFMETLQSYQKDEERNDDITVIAFKF
jgi:serine phosphatase RsbU (regulator of sigma subunit)